MSDAGELTLTVQLPADVARAAMAAAANPNNGTSLSALVHRSLVSAPEVWAEMRRIAPALPVYGEGQQ
jgi:hypothetical protein